MDVFFCLVADVQVDTSPHYLVFVELDGEEDSKKLTEKQATLVRYWRT